MNCLSSQKIKKVKIFPVNELLNIFLYYALEFNVSLNPIRIGRDIYFSEDI